MRSSEVMSLLYDLRKGTHLHYHMWAPAPPKPEHIHALSAQLREKIESLPTTDGARCALNGRDASRNNRGAGNLVGDLVQQPITPPKRAPWRRLRYNRGHK